jgi:hypothetical protein
MEDERGKRNIYSKIMYMEALLVSYTLGFREAIGKLVQITFCHFLKKIPY